MSQISIQDKIVVNAPIDQAWEAIRDPEIHAEWHPFVTHIRGEHQLGAVRKCDVNIGNKPGHTEERCALYEEGRKIMWLIQSDSTGFSRMVSDWTAGFSLESRDPNSTHVMAQSIFRPKNFLVRLMVPMIKGRFHQTQQIILSRLKQFVEKQQGQS